MRGFFISQENSPVYRSVKSVVACLLTLSLVFAPTAGYAQAINFLNLPVPGTMVTLSAPHVPVLLKGMTIHPENPLQFDFIIDSGNTGYSVDQIKTESERLVKYFLASMTIPKDDLWVNLSPYENQRIISEELGNTELGRDMLAQDYLLKQLTASLIYPEDELGQKFWDRVYKRAEEEFGTSEIPVNTFNKVWIVPEKATVYEHEQTVYVVNSWLKVMLDSDYRAMEHGNAQVPAQDSNLEVSEQIIREIILPEIEKEVNRGEHFAPLRQIYHSLILAKWYKETVKNSLLAQVYSDRSLTDGINIDNPNIKDDIYAQYMEAYKKGVFNYIKEDYDRLSKEIIPRKYFSGGMKKMMDFSLDRFTLDVTNNTVAVEEPTGDVFEGKFGLAAQKDGSSPILGWTMTLDKARNIIDNAQNYKQGKVLRAVNKLGGSGTKADREKLINLGYRKWVHSVITAKETSVSFESGQGGQMVYSSQKEQWTIVDDFERTELKTISRDWHEGAGYSGYQSTEVEDKFFWAPIDWKSKSSSPITEDEARTMIEGKLEEKHHHLIMDFHISQVIKANGEFEVAYFDGKESEEERKVREAGIWEMHQSYSGGTTDPNLDYWKPYEHIEIVEKSDQSSSPTRIQTSSSPVLLPQESTVKTFLSSLIGLNGLITQEFEALEDGFDAGRIKKIADLAESLRSRLRNFDNIKQVDKIVRTAVLDVLFNRVSTVYLLVESGVTRETLPQIKKYFTEYKQELNKLRAIVNHNELFNIRSYYKEGRFVNTEALFDSPGGSVRSSVKSYTERLIDDLQDAEGIDAKVRLIAQIMAAALDGEQDKAIGALNDFKANESDAKVLSSLNDALEVLKKSKSGQMDASSSPISFGKSMMIFALAAALSCGGGGCTKELTEEEIQQELIQNMDSWTDQQLIDALSSNDWQTQKTAAQLLYERGYEKGINLAIGKIVQPRIEACDVESNAKELVELGEIAIEPLKRYMRSAGPYQATDTEIQSFYVLAEIIDFESGVEFIVWVDQNINFYEFGHIAEALRILILRQDDPITTGLDLLKHPVDIIKLAAAVALSDLGNPDGADYVLNKIIWPKINALPYDGAWEEFLNWGDLGIAIEALMQNIYDTEKSVENRMYSVRLVIRMYNYNESINVLGQLLKDIELIKLPEEQFIKIAQGVIDRPIGSDGNLFSFERAAGLLDHQSPIMRIAALGILGRPVRLSDGSRIGYIDLVMRLAKNDPDERVRGAATQAAYVIVSDKDADFTGLSTEVLIFTLHSPYLDDQADAAKELYERGDVNGIEIARNEVIWPYIKQLYTGHPRIMNTTPYQQIVAMGEIAQVPLMENLQNGKAETDSRKWSASLLNYVGVFDEVIDLLLDVIHRTDGLLYRWWHRAEALRTFSVLFQRQSTEKLYELLNHPDQYVIDYARAELTSRGEDVSSSPVQTKTSSSPAETYAQRLINELKTAKKVKDKIHLIARITAAAVDTRDEGKAVEMFSNILWNHNENIEVKKNVAAALGSFQQEAESASYTLITAIESDPDVDVIAEAEHSLEVLSIDSSSSPISDEQKELEEQLYDHNRTARIRAAKSLSDVMYKNENARARVKDLVLERIGMETKKSMRDALAQSARKLGATDMEIAKAFGEDQASSPIEAQEPAQTARKLAQSLEDLNKEMDQIVVSLDGQMTQELAARIIEIVEQMKKAHEEFQAGSTDRITRNLVADRIGNYINGFGWFIRPGLKKADIELFKDEYKKYKEQLGGFAQEKNRGPEWLAPYKKMIVSDDPQQQKRAAQELQIIDDPWAWHLILEALDYIKGPEDGAVRLEFERARWAQEDLRSSSSSPVEDPSLESKSWNSKVSSESDDNLRETLIQHVTDEDQPWDIRVHAAANLGMMKYHPKAAEALESAINDNNNAVSRTAERALERQIKKKKVDDGSSSPVSDEQQRILDDFILMHIKTSEKINAEIISLEKSARSFDPTALTRMILQLSNSIVKLGHNRKIDHKIQMGVTKGLFKHIYDIQLLIQEDVSEIDAKEVRKRFDLYQSELENLGLIVTDGRLDEIERYYAQDAVVENGKVPGGSSDASGSSSPVSASEDVGGIDMNQIDVETTGSGVTIEFDPVQVQEILDMGITGFAPVIITITPIPSVMPLLGLAPRDEEEEDEAEYALLSKLD